MTVEVVSYPGLTGWDPEQDHFYFELLGETSPTLDTSQGELAAARRGSADEDSDTRVFEYLWTIGHLGVSQHRLTTHHAVGRRTGGAQAFSEGPASKTTEFWDNLRDPAAEVFVFFPQTGGWRVSELGATVKYLTPLPDEDTFADRAAKDMQLIQPVAAAAGGLANVAAPGVGSLVSGSARLVGAAAQMKLNSVPQTEGFPWSAAKASCVWQDQTMAGVAWSLPKSMFDELGGRIMGGVAVIFGPAREQARDAASSEPVDPAPRQIIARAVVHSEVSVSAPPEPNGYIKLCIRPTLPSRAIPPGS